MIHGEINFRSEPDSADVGDDEWGRRRKICEFFLINKDDDDSLYFMYALYNKLTNHSHFPPAIYRFNLTTE